MADKKITQLNGLAAAEATDVFAIVDITGVDETKKITLANLMGGPGPIGVNTPDSGTFTAMELSAGPQVDEISTDTNLGNNDDVLPTQNAVKTYVDNQISIVSSTIVNPIHVSSDSTAVIGDVMLVDTTNGDVDIELIETPKGRISVIKVSPDANRVIVTPRMGNVNGLPQDIIDVQWGSYTYLTDTNNFYIV